MDNLTYELTCGPSDDRRTLRLELPINPLDGNSILVSYTGGIDSALLLYLLAKLNNNQAIPYLIQPLVIDNRLGSADDPNNKFAAGITETLPRIPDTIKSFSKTFPNSRILDLIKSTADPTVVQRLQIGPAVRRVYNQGNYQYIYSGINESPSEEECWGGPHHANLPASADEIPHPWKIPFLKLQKTHIMDIIIQLGAFEILRLCTKCSGHTSLEDKCCAFNCRERWWALNKLNRSDLIVEYFLK
jgi:PP-loop superfamily ATP-utilizing enzyme